MTVSDLLTLYGHRGFISQPRSLRSMIFAWSQLSHQDNALSWLSALALVVVHV